MLRGQNWVSIQLRYAFGDGGMWRVIHEASIATPVVPGTP
jgi:hypothetical protein